MHGNRASIAGTGKAAGVAADIAVRESAGGRSCDV